MEKKIKLTPSEIVDVLRAGLIHAEGVGHNEPDSVWREDYTRVPFVVDAATKIELIVSVQADAAEVCEVEREAPTCLLTASNGETHTLHHWDLELMIDYGLDARGLIVPSADEWDYCNEAVVTYVSTAQTDGSRIVEATVLVFDENEDD